MKDAGSNNENILIVAPTGRDAELAQQVIQEAGFGSEIFEDLRALVPRLEQGCGMVLLAEEALAVGEYVDAFKTALLKQEAWSDLPVLIMTTANLPGRSAQKVLELFGPSVNVSIIERPFHTVTLISSLQMLLRARRRQYQVRRLLKELGDALQQRDEFVSIASHELKTPLTSLKLQNQMYKRAISTRNLEVLTADHWEKSVARADTQLERLSKLIEDLLDVSRIRAGKLTVNLEIVDLSRLTKRVLDQFTPQLLSTGTQVEFEGTEPALGYWDPRRIEQVVANLVGNAIKYGNGKPIHVSITTTAERACLSIRDHGIGISPEDQNRVFQRFERAVKGDSISGLGLGLYIVRQVVEQHGGRAWVDSVLGQGSTFYVELPLSNEAKARSTG